MSVIFNLLLSFKILFLLQLIGRSDSTNLLMSPDEKLNESGSYGDDFEASGTVPTLLMPVGGTNSGRINHRPTVPPLLIETPEMAKERSDAENRIQERKNKAKKREDAKMRVEKERLLRDNADYQDDQPVDVRASTDAAASEMFEKKIAKLKKKYEKKLEAAAADKQDLLEV